ncbi:hypothetical protein LJC20_00340 [Eubacteriales bacterium OttesenSCG-928-M02]|nr:hypothetical protein [Eubacteriales bacterium OttesenSCG-928-M02]
MTHAEKRELSSALAEYIKKACKQNHTANGTKAIAKAVSSLVDLNRAEPTELMLEDVETA